MKTTHLTRSLTVLALLGWGTSLGVADPLGTAFPYQGRLLHSDQAANGFYDLRFALYDSPSPGAGARVGPLLTNSPVVVANGLFTTALDFGLNIFAGSAYWLEVAVRTNGATEDFTVLNPRQVICAVPYSLYTPNAGTAAMANSTVANSVNAASLQTDSVTTDKILNGTITDADINASGISGDKVIGGDLRARRLKVGQGHTLTGDLATIAGGQNNTVEGGHSFIGGGAENRVEDAYASAIGGGTENRLRKSAAWDVIGGGKGNQVGTNSAWNVVAGGRDNTIAPDTYYAAIPGGWSNTVAGSYGFAAGRNAKVQHYGSFVWADAQESDFASTANNQFNVRAEGGVRFVTGGQGVLLNGQPVLSGSVQSSNLAPGAVVQRLNGLKDEVTLAAGTNVTLVTEGNTLRISATPGSVITNAGWGLSGNAGTTTENFLGTTDGQPLELRINSRRALRLEPNTNGAANVIGGSSTNWVAPGVVGATIAGGGAVDFEGGEGGRNSVAGDFTTIGGGVADTIAAGARSATIAGGERNTIQTNAAYATIGGGWVNTIQPDAGSATIGGGDGNSIQANAVVATIGGGQDNTVQADAGLATIGGGRENTIQTAAGSATIGGGWGNTIESMAYWATIGGGWGNKIQTNGSYATIPGGSENSAADYALAAGRRAKANHTGSFVWADSTDADFASAGDNQFSVRASGGVRFVTGGENLLVNGQRVLSGAVQSSNLAPGAVVKSLNSLKDDITLAAGTNVTLTTEGNTLRISATPGTVVTNAGWGLSGNTGTPEGSFLGTTDGQPLQLRANNQVGLHLQADGNVGLGTTSPGGRLHLGTGPAWSGFNYGANLVVDGGRNNAIGLLDSTSGQPWAIANGAGNFMISQMPPLGNTSADPTNRFTITPAGNVGIGTASPAAALDVAGSITYSGQLAKLDVGEAWEATVRAADFKLGHSSRHVTPGRALVDNGNALVLNFGGDWTNTVLGGNVSIGDGQSRYPLSLGGGVGPTKLAVWDNGTDAMGFGIAPQEFRFHLAADHNWFSFFNAPEGTEVMRIKGDGNVGIATTTPSEALEVGGNVKAWSFVGKTLDTTDNQPLELKINGRRALRIEDNGDSFYDVDTLSDGAPNLIGGSPFNFVGTGVVGATIAGGGATNRNGLASTNAVLADYGTVGGGLANRVDLYSFAASIAGGHMNYIGMDSHLSMVGGGYLNWIAAHSEAATIAGGTGNNIGTESDCSTVGGGNNNNIAANSRHATIAGGYENNVSTNNQCGAIPGGYRNYVGGDYAFAAGQRAQASHDGCFVWADTSGGDFQSTANNQFLLRAAGGVAINHNAPQAALDVAGDLQVRGAYKGTLGSNGGAPFPRPAYDSGWLQLSQGESRTLTHNLGGNVDDYFVDMTYKTVSGGMNNYGFGRISVLDEDLDKWVSRGAYWYGLNNSTIGVDRANYDNGAERIRIRIWVCP